MATITGTPTGIPVLRRRPPSEHIVTDVALNLIKGFEGLHLAAYPDPASALAKTGKGSGDPWTIGWGRTKNVKRGDRCTLDQANAWLLEDANEAADIVRAAVQVPLTAGEFAALTSLAYNLGYIPKSMKACLNGGVTDKGVTMEPGSYGAALLQFPRNCRAQTKPMKGLYRRRLAEAAVFSDLPWEDACSPTVVQFALDERGEIDTDATTTLEDTLMRARSSKAPDPGAIFKKSWSELMPVKPEPVAAEAPGKAELPETAAPKPPAPVASAPVSAPPSGPVAQAPVATATPAPQPPSPPVSAPKPPRLPDPPVPVGQQTSAVDATRNSQDWSSNAKAMWQSRRFWGLVLVLGGRLWMLKTGSNAVLGAVSDPLVTEMFSGFMVMMIGEVIQHWGERKATRPLK